MGTWGNKNIGIEEQMWSIWSEDSDEMDNVKKHWPILGEQGTDLENKIRQFLVVGEKGEGLIVAFACSFRFRKHVTNNSNRPSK